MVYAGEYTDNPEWMRVYIDSENRVLWGIKTNGNIEWSKGIPTPVQEKLTELEGSISGNITENINQFQSKIEEINEQLNPLTETFNIVENPEWLQVTVDQNNTILEGIKEDGTKYFPKQELLEEYNDPENRIEITIDSDNRVLSYRDSDGVKHESKLDVDQLTQNGREIDVDNLVVKNDLNDLATKEDLKDVDVSNTNISELEGVSDHNTPNLLVASELEKTFNDGTNSFTPPNAGYEMSNRIEVSAGDWITRTGTATGMVVVTDENDKNGTRLFNSDGTTLGNTFKIPDDMTWVKYIRLAVEVSGAKDGSVIICKGRHAFTGDNKGDFLTIDKLKLQEANIPKDIRYLKSSDGKYWEMYVDDSHTLQIREIDPDIITDLPADFPEYEITGNFSEYFDTWTSFSNSYLMERNKNGVLKYYNALSNQTNYADFRKTKNTSNEVRYLKAYTEGYTGPQGEKLLTIYDENFKIIDTNIGGQNGRDIDPHDYVYFEDNHVATFGHENGIISIPVNEENSDFVEINFGNITNYWAYILEWKKIDGVWTIIGEFNMKDYPRLLTDAFGCYSDNETLGVHPNTLFLDYDGNYVMNLRNNDSWIKVKRTENEDGTVTIGSKTLNYDEAIIGRVGGKYNSGYIDNKRVIEEEFIFTDNPTSLSDRSTDEEPEWKFYHIHDVNYWGMKNIEGQNYPTYLLFDNNMWTGNEKTSNYIDVNPRNNENNNPTADDESSFINSKSDSGGTYDTHMVSRAVQLSIDWENHLIKDYRVYIIPKHYSGTRGSVQMFDEGVLLINWSDQGKCGLYDFNDEQTQIESHTYRSGKELWNVTNVRSFRVYGLKNN